MLPVIMIILGIIFIILMIIANHTNHMDHEDIFFTCIFIDIIISFIEVICIIILSFFICDVVSLKTSDKKITMYQEENENIQNQINQIISNYKEYEQDTFSKSIENLNLENTDVVVLAQLYPELKSNEMVNNQINIYQENNKKIKELKEEKINKQISKWWLYFGSID